MPDQGFQDRLQRIARDSRHAGQGSSDISRRQGPDLRRVMIGVILTTLGAGLVKAVNISYDSIRESSGIAVAIGSGLGALATVVLGGTLTLRGLRSIKAKGPHAAPAAFATAEPTRLATQAPPGKASKASGRSRTVTSLLGFALGIGASASLFIASAAQLVESEQSQAVVITATLAALLLAVVSLTVGVVGLFVRGFSLGRVPLYFIAGVILTLAAGRFFRVDVTKWPAFTALVH